MRASILGGPDGRRRTLGEKLFRDPDDEGAQNPQFCMIRSPPLEWGASLETTEVCGNLGNLSLLFFELGGEVGPFVGEAV